MHAAFRENDFRLIAALSPGKSGNGPEGLMGSDAGRSLLRLPSAVYWGIIGRWRIIAPGLSIDSYFKRELLRREEIEHSRDR